MIQFMRQIFISIKIFEMETSIALAIALALEDTPTRRKRSKWSKKWFLRRREFGHARLLMELKDDEPDDFRNFLRMDAASYEELLALVRPMIQKEDTIMREAIPASERLSITLRFLATGNYFEDLKFLCRTSPQAIGRIVFETCEAIIQCLQRQQTIKIPDTHEEWIEISNPFATIWNFPHCVGAIDGKHVAIKKPPHSGSFYYNYKKFFSIVLMAVVAADYEFIMIDVGVNGRVSDGGVIAVTEFGRLLDDGKLGLPQPEPLHDDDVTAMPYVFVGDDAFAMTKNLLKPYGGNRLEHSERIFNYRLSRARRVSENAFGILAARFGVFQRPMQLSPEKATTITMACCYLHNFLRKKSSRYIAPGTVDWDDANHEVQAGEWRASQRQLERLRPTMNRNAGNTGRLAREAFRHYFGTRGQVPWQDDRV